MSEFRVSVSHAAFHLHLSLALSRFRSVSFHRSRNPLSPLRRPHLDLDVCVFERDVCARGDGDRDLAHAGLLGRPPHIDLRPRADDERRGAGMRRPAAARGGPACGGHRAPHRRRLHRVAQSNWKRTEHTPWECACKEKKRRGKSSDFKRRRLDVDLQPALSPQRSSRLAVFRFRFVLSFFFYTTSLAGEGA